MAQFGRKAPGVCQACSGARRQARIQMPGAGVVRCQTPGNKRLVSKENRSQGQTHKTAIISDVANCTCEADTSESCRHSITISPVARRVESGVSVERVVKFTMYTTKESESQSGVAFDRILIAHGLDVLGAILVLFPNTANSKSLRTG